MNRYGEYLWSVEKNEQLLAQRGLSFELVIAAIENGKLIADIPHTNTIRFAHQRILVVDIVGYVCAVPYVTDGRKRFLKTIYRSRDLRDLFAPGMK